MTNVDFEGWFAAYRPRVNADLGDHSSDNPVYLFETFGDDLATVERARIAAPSLIWTLVKGESGDLIIEGYHWVNRPISSRRCLIPTVSSMSYLPEHRCEVFGRATDGGSRD